MPKKLIIPIFIPFGGCKSRCVYCDQAGITGTSAPPEEAAIRETVETWLSTWERKWGQKRNGRTREVAFYGGSFTALPESVQARLLASVAGYLDSGRVDAIRVSTRPDRITDAGIELLKTHNVKTVELGVQSMSDTVLKLSGRGHTAQDSIDAAALLKERSVRVGLQFMPGLPGDTVESITYTVEKIVEMAPAFVRVYPTVVLKDTPLEEMYSRGDYKPWPMVEMLKVCKDLRAVFSGAAIPIIRMGLHHSPELEGRVVAGPYHQSFADMVSRA
jgi:histone acetyltransferase (RNA polymerase elongator complex component)